MANNKTEDRGADLRNYASRHPKRMNGGAMLVGTALGAGLMAAKQMRAKTPVQKFMDRLSK
jgi:hypothetical protein